MLKNPVILYLSVLLIAFFPIWGHIDELPIQLWDESRLAMNAYEMYKDHHFITTHFMGEPDMWNTKPPFLVWMQVLSFNIFGVSEMSLRLPSALAGTVTCLLLFWFFNKKLQSPLTGILSVIILVTSYGYVKYHHSVRTGDYDAMLTLFITGTALFYYLYIEENKRKYLALALSCIILAVMTKSVTGLFITPSLLFYTIYARKLPQVLKSPVLYAGIVVFILIVGSYYYIREQHNPGYLAQVQFNELGGRFVDLADNIGETRPAFYFYLLKEKDFKFWIFLLPVGVMMGLYAVNKKHKNIIVLSIIAVITIFTIIAQAATKKDWYDMPLMPFLSIIAAYAVAAICVMLKKLTVWNEVVSKNILPYAFMLIVCTPAYYEAIMNSMYPDPGDWIRHNTNMCKYLKDIYHGNIRLTKPLIIVKEKYDANVDWYAKVLSDKHIDVKVIKFDEIQPGQVVLAYENEIKRKIEDNLVSFAGEKNYDGDLVRYFVNGKK